MELRHLRYFIVVAEELHFTRAAARLNIAQPPLSQQIQALEREIGANLFHRIGRRIELTDAGKLFLADARSLIANLERAVERARRARAGETGCIRVGFTESASFNKIVTTAIRGYRAHYPEVELTLTESQSTALARALATDEIDVAFLRPPVSKDKRLTFKMLKQEKMVVALPAGHSLAVDGPINLSELAGETFILYPRSNGSGLSDLVVSACLAAGFTPEAGQHTPQLSSTINLVAAGLGIAIVPETMRQLQSHQVFYRALADGPAAVLGLAYRKDERSAPVLNFISQVKPA